MIKLTRISLVFWILQVVGWPPIFILLLALFGSDSVFSTGAVTFATSLITITLIMTLAMRTLYRRFIKTKLSTLIWGLLLISISFTVSIIVPLVHWGLWFTVSQIDMAYAPIYTSQPPFSVAFVLVLPLFIWSCLYWTIKRQTSLYQLTEQSEISRLKMKEAQLTSLVEQLSPHFMFNTINNIRAMVLMDSDKARDMLMAFADLMRYQLTQQVKTTVTLQEELTFVADFVALHQLQLGKRLCLEIDFDERFLPKLVPKMALQLLVENAIKHGFCQQAQSGVLSIVVTSLSHDKWQLTVSNPGRLEQDNINPDNTGIGLSNLRERLSLFTEQKITFTLGSSSDRVTATLEFSNL